MLITGVSRRRVTPLSWVPWRAVHTRARPRCAAFCTCVRSRVRVVEQPRLQAGGIAEAATRHIACEGAARHDIEEAKGSTMTPQQRCKNTTSSALYRSSGPFLVALAILASSDWTWAQDPVPEQRAKPRRSAIPSSTPALPTPSADPSDAPAAGAPEAPPPVESSSEDASRDAPSPDDVPPDEGSQRDPSARAPVIAAAPEAPTTCSKEQSRAAFEHASRAMVSVEGPLFPAVGFVFQTPSHVVTTFDAVEWGRGVEVVLSDGSRHETHIVAIDRAQNLAILRLDTTTGVTPLRSSATDADIGDAVLAVGRKPFEPGAPRVIIHDGRVTGKRGRNRQSDALDGGDLVAGGPVLDCDGGVLGIANDRLGDGFVTIDQASLLASEVGTQPEYRGGWSMNHPSAGMVVQGAPGQMGIGMSVGTALIGNDQWYLPLRFSALYLTKPRLQDDERVDGFRAQLEAGIGYRAMLTGGEMPLYLTPTVGVVAQYDAIRSQRCDGACDAANVLDTHHLERFRTLPTLGLGLGFAFGEISYQLQLDVKDPKASTHQVFIGFQF